MPQSFHVVRCFSCSIFQVHIVKKVNKWQCKVCNEKQSVKKVYGEGSSKDCRNHVQRLNSLQLAADQDSAIIEQASHLEASAGNAACHDEPGDYSSQANDIASSHDNSTAQPSRSKWNQYIQPKTQISSSSEEDEMLRSHLMRRKKAPQKKHSRNQVTKSVGSTSSKWGQYVTPTLSDDEDYSVQTHSSNTKVLDIRSSKWRDFRIQNNEEKEEIDPVPQQTQKITNDWGQFDTASNNIETHETNPMKKQKLEFRNNLRDSKNENWQATGKATEVKKQWNNILDKNKIFDVQVKSVPNTLTSSMKHENVQSKWGKYLSPDKESKHDEECDTETNEELSQAQFSYMQDDGVVRGLDVSPLTATNSKQNEQERKGATSDKPILFNSGDISDDELDQLLQF